MLDCSFHYTNILLTPQINVFIMVWLTRKVKDGMMAAISSVSVKMLYMDSTDVTKSMLSIVKVLRAAYWISIHITEANRED